MLIGWAIDFVVQQNFIIKFISDPNEMRSKKS